MIQILYTCEQINSFLKIYPESVVLDYRIFLRKNENLYVDVLISDKVKRTDISSIIRQIKNISSFANVEILKQSDLDNDAYYRSLFQKSDNSKVILTSGRRRNDSVWGRRATRVDDRCPIVTFYSYKGGMGRSTTLAAYASYLTLCHKKKVVIVDFDLEAPGFTNFFLINPAEKNQRNGLVEYVLDKETGFASGADIRNYIWEVDHSFTDEGTIYIMPSGNLDSEYVCENMPRETHLSHYIEGISRIDFSNMEYSYQLFHGVMEDLCCELNPDIILIDSKTGISDIMGITVCQLSDKAVGFFRNDMQSFPGLYFFIESMLKSSAVEPFLVNSILPPALKGKKLFEQFKNDVTDIIDSISPSSGCAFQCFPITRVEELSLIGTNAEDIGEFSEMIRCGMIKDYSELFDSITKSVFTRTPVQEDIADKCKSRRDKILKNTANVLESIDLYADSVDIQADLSKGTFFYRRCMGDLLNMDKFLVLGSKGTGKSYLYNALREPAVVERIKSNTSKQGNYLFFYTIDRTNRILHTDRIDGGVSPNAKYRYWIIYTWNSIISDVKSHFPDLAIAEDLIKFAPDDTDRSVRIIQDLIEDDNYVQQVEDQLMKLNDYLKAKEEPTFLTIIYDQLDEIVKPDEWQSWTPELIRYWRMKRFSHISGKLFMRTDLFRNLYGINNINEISNNSINIEWSKDELFSYFFQIALSNKTDADFWDIMECYGDFSIEIIGECKKEYNLAQNRLTPYDSKVLVPMVYTYFGEYVDVNNSSRMGTSYDWFYRNLKNADDTISIRPFISLIKSAIKLVPEFINDSYKPILFQKCYTNRDVRTNAVKEHYEDMLSDMIGGKFIRYIFEYISQTNDIRFKKISQKESVFSHLLKNVVNIIKDKEDGADADVTVDKLKELLLVNGIVCTRNYGYGDVYVFSFLYKYNLGLKGS